MLLPEFIGFREPLLSAAGVAGVSSAAGLLLGRCGNGVRGCGVWLLRRSRGAVWIGAGVFFVYFCAFGLLRHFSLSSGSSDLGWENQVLYNIATTGEPFSSIGWFEGSYFRAHVPAIYYVLAPVYGLAPFPETFILLQAAILALGAVAVWWYVREAAHSRCAAILAGLAYLLHPCATGMATFDVHSSPLAIPLVIGAAASFVRGRMLLGWVLILLGMSCREEMILSGLIVSVVLMSRKRVGTCSALAAVAVLANYLVCAKLMVTLGGSPNYVRYPFFQDENGVVGVVQILSKFASAPVETMAHFLRAPKLAYLAVMMLPVGLLPVLSGRFLLAAAPGLFVTLGASYPGHYIAGYQYGTLLLLAIFLCFPMGWRAAARLRRRVRGGGLVLAGGVICASVSANALWGNFFAQNYAVDYVNPRVGSGTYLGQLGTYSEWPFEPGRVRDVWAVREMIPAEARVAASFHLVPHFSSRRWVTAMESENAVRAEYLVLDPTSLLKRDREALPALLKGFEAAGGSGPIRWYRRRGG